MATKNSAAASPLVQRKFGFRDVLAYGAGDFGCNMSFALKGTLSLFWTQFMGINPITMPPTARSSRRAVPSARWPAACPRR